MILITRIFSLIAMTLASTAIFAMEVAENNPTVVNNCTKITLQAYKKNAQKKKIAELSRNSHARTIYGSRLILDIARQNKKNEIIKARRNYLGHSLKNSSPNKYQEQEKIVREAKANHHKISKLKKQETSFTQLPGLETVSAENSTQHAQQSSSHTKNTAQRKLQPKSLKF